MLMDAQYINILVMIAEEICSEVAVINIFLQDIFEQSLSYCTFYWQHHHKLPMNERDCVIVSPFHSDIMNNHLIIYMFKMIYIETEKEERVHIFGYNLECHIIVCIVRQKETKTVSEIRCFHGRLLCDLL